MQHASWRSLARLSSGLGRIDGFLASASFDRGPWLAVAFASGVAAWFTLPRVWHWQALLAGCAGALAASLAWRAGWRRWPFLLQAVAALALTMGAGCGVVWLRSALIGAPGLARPLVVTLLGRVSEWREAPAEARGRLTMIARDPLVPDRAIRVRIAVPLAADQPALREGAVVRVRARLMPPAASMFPGSYDFARAAWFAGIGATGSALGPLQIVDPGRGGGGLGPLRRALSDHIAAALPGSPGGIAAALASGDRGAIARADEDAMRDAGLTHLLSVSGLHVSAVIGAAYLLTLRLLALWPWLALRLRLPLVAAGGGAGAGVFYTALTGAEVPTLRSTFAALLALAAAALGREPLGLRLLAIASGAIMLFWPEAVVGPSFQLSFAAALAIVALHGTGWMRRLAGPREEGWALRTLRMAAGLLVTGLVVELALLPIGLFHFHRAGIYGALANIVAIPLTTLVTMPLVALALLCDLAGLGDPVWWLVGRSIQLLLDLAHAVAAMPGAVTVLPTMARPTYALFLGGGLWLALWSGSVRKWGLLPLAFATGQLTAERPPDVLVSADGRIVAFTSLAAHRLVVLRPTQGAFARDILAEMTGFEPPGRATAPARQKAGSASDELSTSDPFVQIDAVQGARCNPDYCLVSVGRATGARRFLLARGRDPAPMRNLVATCARVDVAIADRSLPWACRPAWLKLDRSGLAQTGGVALWLGPEAMKTVADDVGDHGWWHPPQRPGDDRRIEPSPAAPSPAAPSPAAQVQSGGARAAATEAAVASSGAASAQRALAQKPSTVAADTAPVRPAHNYRSAHANRAPKR